MLLSPVSLQDFFADLAWPQVIVTSVSRAIFIPADGVVAQQQLGSANRQPTNFIRH